MGIHSDLLLHLLLLVIISYTKAYKTNSNLSDRLDGISPRNKTVLTVVNAVQPRSQDFSLYLKKGKSPGNEVERSGFYSNKAYS